MPSSVHIVSEASKAHVCSGKNTRNTRIKTVHYVQVTKSLYVVFLFVDIYYKAKNNICLLFTNILVKWIWLIVFPDRISQAIQNFFFKSKDSKYFCLQSGDKFTTISEIKYKENMFLSPIFGLATYSMTKLKFLNSSNLYKGVGCWPFSLRCFFLNFLVIKRQSNT